MSEVPTSQLSPPVTPATDADINDEAFAAFDDKVFHRSCYLSGPMTGIENFNFPAFEKATADLRSRGWKVYSPHELGWGDGNPETGQVSPEEYRLFMGEDLKQVCGSDAVICLPDWEDSKGANLEVQTARVCGRGPCA